MVGALLGEQEISLPFRASNLRDASGFIPVESKGRGYRYDKDDQQVTVKRVDAWALVAGLPPLYYFRGTLISDARNPVLKGQIRMSPLARCFVFAWVGIVFVAFLGTLLWAMILAGQFMISPSAEIKSNLTTAGFFSGAIIGLAIFGTVIISIMRTISRSQKQKLVSFLVSLGPR
jgi:hypothetical protein